MRRPAMLAIAVAGSTLALGSCGIGTSGEVESIDPEILQALDPTAPTTTTTTTEPVAPTPPESPVTQPPGSTTTTGHSPVTTSATESFTLYFIDGERLVPVEVALDSGSERRQLAALGEGPPQEAADVGVRTAVPLDLVRSVRLLGDEVTVDLVEELYGNIDPDDQRAMTGQIVLTLTLDDRSRRVRFTLDGEPLRVFRQDGTPSDPGETVGWDDYSILLEDEATRIAGDDD